MEFDEWKQLWISTAIMKGHNFAVDQDGEIDIAAFTISDNHYGPVCVVCGWAVCMFCHSNINDIPKCEV